MSDYTTPLSITSQFAFCGLPLRLDTYRGCGFRCSYCFARYRGGNQPDDKVSAADPRRIDRMFKRALENDGAGVVAEFLRRRTPVHFGGMSDPLQPAERLHGVTASAIRTLVRYQYPTVLSTRSPLASEPLFAGLLKDLGVVVVQFSFSSTRDEVARRVEPESTRPSVLLKTMEHLSRQGVTVTCRWQPYIPGVSEDSAEFVARVAATGCRHISFEHLKLPLEQGNALWTQFTRNIERDIVSEYRLRNAHRDGREMILPASEKLKMLLAARAAVHNAGMTFGAADNEFQYLSDTECCCSGVDQFPGFNNWFRHQIGAAVRRAYVSGTAIRYSAIENEWCPEGSLDRHLNSRSRISAGGGPGLVSDHVKARWNRSHGPGSPSTFFGITPLDCHDSNGLETYAWDPALRRALPEVWAK